MAAMCRAGWSITTALSGRHDHYNFVDQKTEFREVQYLVRHYTAIDYGAELELRIAQLHKPHS